MSKCDCGRVIWPWQGIVIDSESSLCLHVSCADDQEPDGSES